MANFAGVLNELQQERDHAVQQVDRLDEAIAALGKLVGSNHTKLAQMKSPRKRRTMSAAARRKIASAQRARWAKARRAGTSTPVRTMSQAARNKIAAAQRARWAKTRAQQKEGGVRKR